MEYTEKVAAENLKPIIDFCQANRGTIDLIHRAYEKRVGKPVVRANIQRWLAPAEATWRIEPSYGKGLVLVAVATDVIRRVKAGRLVPTCEKPRTKKVAA